MAKTIYTVIYDGDCGFCQSTVNMIRRVDWLNKFEFVPFQDKSVLKEHKVLTKEMCEKEIYLVKPNKESISYYGGYDAFKIMAVFLPLTFLISWFFLLPGIVQIGRIIYKFIAGNRHKIRIGKLVCKVKEQK